MKVEVNIENNNIDAVKKALEEQSKAGLTAVGLQAERHAKEIVTYDTGLLRNSITYALAGEPPAISGYEADRGGKTGVYAGDAPKDGDDDLSVYIGTNVEYAPFVENGASGRKAKPFLKPAIQNYKSEYEEILKRYLKGDGS